MILKKPVVFLVCTGLGKINRGYESFAKECFDTLKDAEQFELYLIKGGGKAKEKEKVVFNFHRNGKIALFFKKVFEQAAYSTEQKSFCFFLLPLIIKKKPALIYYSDFALGSYLWHLKKYFQFRYRLLFCNGAPNGPPYKTEDHIQQLLPVYYDIGVKADGNKLKHTFLPYAFTINVEKNKEYIDARGAIRKRLGFLPEQKIILAVGAINKSHKRVDYIINETTLLPDNYFLIILGQHDDETEALVHLAKEKLPGRYLMNNLPHDELTPYYAAADYFVLASLQEGFPRVTIEALSYGLPCIVHDYIVTRQILGDKGLYIDMRFEGELSNCIKNIHTHDNYKLNAIETAYNFYSWDTLKEKYLGMINEQASVTKKAV